MTTGKDRGKSGTVLRAFPREAKVLVEGVNIVKKHKRATRESSACQIVERTMPVDVSNVALKDPKGGKATRVGYKVEGGKKIRIAKKSGAKVS